MSKVSESRLWNWLTSGTKQKFRKTLHMNRVENLIMEGMPDVEGCLRGTQFWIELKCDKRPADPSTLIKPKFRPAQVPWLERRVGAGGRAYVLLQVGGGAKASRYLVPGSRAYLVESGLTEAELKRKSVADPQSAPTEIIMAAIGRH